MKTLDDVRSWIAADHGLAVVTTLRSDGSVQATVVNVGLLDHPVSGVEILGFVVFGSARKLVNLRRDPRVTITFRKGWDWLTVDGAAELAGPDDPLDGLDQAAIPQLLRDVFSGAGGTHDDWDEYDRVMAEQRRAAVLVTPNRIYSNT